MLKGNLFHGAGYLGDGFRLIRKPGLRLFVILPLIINIILFGVLVWLLGEGFAMMVDSAMSSLPDWAWLQPLEWLFWLLYGVVILLLLAYGFVMLANLIGSPFYGYLSELAEKEVRGQRPVLDESWSQILWEIPRAFLRETQKILYYLPWALVLLVLGLIPVVNLVAGVLWFLLNSWMMTLQYVDFPADNHRLSFPALRRKIAQRRLTAIGFGMPVAVLSMVPLVNLVLVPAAVCGGTVYWVKQEESV